MRRPIAITALAACLGIAAFSIPQITDDNRVEALNASAPVTVDIPEPLPVYGEQAAWEGVQTLIDQQVAAYVAAVEEAQRQEWFAAVAAAEAQRIADEEAAAARAAERAAAREAAAAQAASEPEPAAPSGDVWERLAQCESGMTNANTGNGYYGYFQFSATTWRSVGGTGLPTDHGYGEQVHRAQILQARSGWGQWPACSRRLGLR